MYKEKLKKLISNEPKSYEEYLAENGITNESDYKDSLSKINADAMLNRGAGVKSEKLSRSGLAASGYADYLKTKRVSGYESERSDAYLSYMKAKQTSTDGYGKYLDDYDRLQEKEHGELINYLKENRIFTKEGALDVVKESGLTVDNAMDVITRGVWIARQQAINEAVEFSVRRLYSFYAARRYALSIGLPPEDAYKVAQETLNYNHSESALKEIYGDETYLESLQEKLELLKEKE